MEKSKVNSNSPSLQIYGRISRPLNTSYTPVLQFITTQIICLYLQDFVPLQYKSCRYLC